MQTSKTQAVQIKSSFKETSGSINKTSKFDVIMIQEGLGNFRDCFYYTKEALQQAVKDQLFEGSQCFADHPSEIEEVSRPERSTRDIIGYFEDVRFEEADGLGQIMATLCVANNISLDWAMSLLTNSLGYSKKYKEKDFTGFSINASGEASVVDLDDFMKNESIPKLALSKLIEAKSQGIGEIKPVTRLTEAISCDFVTKAGAGGKILKMLEGEKKMKQAEKKEAEAKLKHSEAEDEMPAKKPADGDHEDEDQDKALFAKMIKQYLGKDAEGQETEAMEMAKHAHEAYQAEGMEGNEAYEAAGKHLKMAMAIGKKMAAKKGDEDADASESESEAETHESESEAESEAKEKHKESFQKKFIQLQAEVAKLREASRKVELASYLDAKLSALKQPHSVTKLIRESIGSAKTKAQIDDTIKIFMKAYEAKSGEADADQGFVFTEKSTFKTSSEGKVGSLEDCLD